MDYNPVLEHSLHQLLRESHHHNIHTSVPHPVSALLGMSKQRRLAGPHAHNRADLVEIAHRFEDYQIIDNGCLPFPFIWKLASHKLSLFFFVANAILKVGVVFVCLIEN